MKKNKVMIFLCSALIWVSCGTNKSSKSDSVWGEWEAECIELDIIWFNEGDKFRGTSSNGFGEAIFKQIDEGKLYVFAGSDDALWVELEDYIQGIVLKDFKNDHIHEIYYPVFKLYWEIACIPYQDVKMREQAVDEIYEKYGFEYILDEYWREIHFHSQWRHFFGELGYNYYDIDRDGVDELVIYHVWGDGNTDGISAIYTAKGGKIYPLFFGGENYIATLSEEKDVYTYMWLGKMAERYTLSGTQLILAERIEYRSSDAEPNVYTVRGEDGIYESFEISDERAHEIYAGWKSHMIEDMEIKVIRNDGV